MSEEKKDIVVDARVEAPVVVAVAQPAGTEKGVNPISTMKGAVIKQESQELECIIQYLFITCFEMDNIYRYAPLPPEKQALKKLSKDNGWRPTMTELNNMPKNFINTERSNTVLKTALACLGCVTCRPFEMDFTATNNPDLSFMHIDRKFALGGFWCCPHSADVSVGGEVVGRVVEDWNCNSPLKYFMRCFEYCFMCRVPYDLQLVQNGVYANRYRINVNQCACGPHCNFCGGTIFCNDQLFDVAPYTSTGAVDVANPSGRIQRTYGGKLEPEACWRWYFCSADNLIVEWEDKATIEERALFLTAATLLDYVFFEGKDQRRTQHHYCCIQACSS